MKTTVKNIRRTIATIAILGIISASSFSQGLLVEGTVKVFESLKKKNETPEVVYHYANYEAVAETNKRNFHLADFLGAIKNRIQYDENLIENDLAIVESLKVSNLEIAFEKELTSEAWMTESFAGSLESAVETENWMTESFAGSFESAVETENWMTESFAGSFEESVETEDWMTESFAGSFEESIETEDWMTELMR